MATVDQATPLEFPGKWIRGDTIGPIITTVTGRSVAGATARLTFRRGGFEGEIVQCCSSDPDLLVGDSSSLIVLDDVANTATVEPFEPSTVGQLFYDLELRWLSGNPRVATIHRGRWKLEQDASL